jgi:hypothetical protein
MSKLWEALDILQERGLAKRKLIDPDTGAVCARGALLMATTGTLNMGYYAQCASDDRILGETARELFRGRVRDMDAVGLQFDIVDFNNHPDTTLADMVQVFEKTAIRGDEVLNIRP